MSNSFCFFEYSEQLQLIMFYQRYSFPLTKHHLSFLFNFRMQSPTLNYKISRFQFQNDLINELKFEMFNAF